MKCPRCGYVFNNILPTERIRYNESRYPYLLERFNNISERYVGDEYEQHQYQPHPFPTDNREDYGCYTGLVRFSDTILLFSNTDERIIEIKKNELYILVRGLSYLYKTINNSVFNFIEKQKDKKIDYNKLQMTITSQLDETHKYFNPNHFKLCEAHTHLLDLYFVFNNGEISSVSYKSLCSGGGLFGGSYICWMSTIRNYLHGKSVLRGDFGIINDTSENIINILKQHYEEKDEELIIKELKIIKNIGGD